MYKRTENDHLAFNGPASSASLLSWLWYTGTDGCVFVCVCAVRAQWELDGECF